ncbi:MAG: two-component system, chemotaxis family, chemotaxis protein CheY [Massilia sp.]|jgi:two-component system chemotaxis response regulator CheY
MKVLVVDDDVVSRMMLMHLVDSCGKYDILEAEDGLDAWRQLEGGLRPAITFCDLRMPQLSGTDLLARVKARPELADMRFVLVSAANDGATIDEAVALGADGYVLKPFRIEGLRPHLMALEADEAPGACARRLGIAPARLALYLDALERQLLEAGPAIEVLLGQGEAAGARERLARLRSGCSTLGLRGAATRLARAESAPQPELVAQALAAARAAVACQAGLLAASDDAAT